MRREIGSGWVERKGGGNLAVVWWTICLQRQLELRLSLTKIHKGEGLHFQHNILHFFAHNELTNASLANDEATANSTFFFKKKWYNYRYTHNTHLCEHKWAACARQQCATRAWSHIGVHTGESLWSRNPLPFLSSHRQLPQPPNAYQHTNIRLATLPPLCQAVVAVSVASSVTGEVPCYSRHCCRSATLRLCSAHQ